MSDSICHQDNLSQAQHHTGALAAPRNTSGPELPSRYRCCTCKHRIKWLTCLGDGRGGNIVGELVELVKVMVVMNYSDSQGDVEIRVVALRLWCDVIF